MSVTLTSLGDIVIVRAEEKKKKRASFLTQRDIIGKSGVEGLETLLQSLGSKFIDAKQIYGIIALIHSKDSARLVSERDGAGAGISIKV